MPPIPRIISAVYNPVSNLTIVRAAIAVEANAHPALYGVGVTVLDQGETEAWRFGDLVSGPPLHQWTYEIRFFGDLRGRKIVALTSRGLSFNEPPADTSELSEPVEIQ